VLLILAIFLAALLILRKALFIAVVLGDSMAPALASGDKLLVLSLFPQSLLRKGQIVVLDYQYADNPLVKRIIGLPGDKVSVPLTELPSNVYIESEYLEKTTSHYIWSIPPESYFVKGDAGGTDSTRFGPTSFSSLRGIALIKLTSGRKFIL
jgi:signal peptidase I